MADDVFTERLAAIEEQGAWGEVYQVLCERAGLETVSREVVRLWQRAAEVASSRLEDPVLAEVSLREALANQPFEPTLIEPLAELLEKRGDQEGSAELLERLAAGAEPASGAAAYVRLGRIYQGQLARPARALLCYRRALRKAPTDPAARVEFEQLALAEHRFGVLVALCESLDGNHPARLAASLQTLGERLLESPLQFGKAIRCLERAKQVVPGHPGATAALRKLEQIGKDWSRLALQRREAAAEEKDPHVAAGSYLWVAQLYAVLDRNSETQVQENLGRCFVLWPGMPAALDTLEDLGTLWQRPEWAVQRLEALASTTWERAVGAELWSRVARLRLAPLGDRDAATAALIQAFRLEPSRQDTALLLAEMLIEGHKEAQASEVIEKHLAAADATQLQAASSFALRLLLTELLVNPLRQADRARAHLRHLVERGPTEPAALERLGVLAEALGDPAQQAQVLELKLRQRRRKDRPDLLARLARMYEQDLKQPNLALRTWARLLPANPQDPTALEALVRLADQYQLDQELWQACEVALTVARDRAGATRLARLLAQRFQGQPGSGLARGAWEWVKRLDPDSPEAVPPGVIGGIESKMGSSRDAGGVDPIDPVSFEKFAAQLEGNQRWDELGGLLERTAEARAASGQVAEAAGLQLRLGRLRQERLHDYTGALECFSWVLERQPHNPQVVPAVLELLALPASEDELRTGAELIEPYLVQSRDSERLVQVLQIHADHAETPSDRAELLRRAAALYADEVAQPDLAFMAISRALREEPEDASALALALRTAERAGLAEELAQLLEELGPRVQDAEAARKLHRALACLYQRPLGDPARAIQEWRLVFDSSQSDAEAVEELCALYSERGDHASAIELLRRKLAITDEVGERCALLHRIGEFQDEGQGDYAAAFATYRRLLELAPDDRVALSKLEGLCVRQERWPELGQVLDQEARLAGAAGEIEAQVRLWVRLAQLREGPLRDPEGAMALYRSILEARPDQGEAVERLEAILAREPQNADVAELLQQVYGASGEWLKYSTAIDARASALHDPQARRDLLLELAKVREERLARPDLAFIALCRAFRDDPADPGLRSELARVAELAGTHEELRGIYEEELERGGPPGVSAALHLEIGRLLERAGEQGPALAAYERARELDPAAGVAALPDLERLYRLSERWDALSGVLEQRAERATDPTEKASSLLALAQLVEGRLGDRERATSVYESILGLDPKSTPALRALEGLYEASGRDDALAGVLEQLQADASPGPARDRVLGRLAELASRRGDPARAAALWKDLLARNPKAEPVWAGLEAALEQLGRWEDLVALLRHKLEGLTDPREGAKLNERIGMLLATRLGKSAEAVASLRSVLERDPKNRRALEALRDIHRAKGEGEELAQVLRRLIALQDSAAGVKEIRLQLATVLGELGRREEAVEAARRALDLEPHRVEEVAQAENIFRSLSAWPEALRAMEARAALYGSEQREEAIKTYLGIAALCTESLKRPEVGAPALERVLELDPLNQKAIGELKQIYTKSGDWRRYAALLDRLARGAAQPELQILLLRELAEVHEQRLGQKQMAFLALCRAFQGDPLQAEVATAVRRLARETGAVEELAEIYDTVLEDAKPGPTAETLFLSLAEIQDQDLDNPGAAEASLRKLLALEPTHLPALEALAAIFQRRGRGREYAVSLEQKVEALASLEDKKRTLIELATAYDELLGEADEAAIALQRGLELDSGDPVLMDHLAKLYRREKAWPALIVLLQRARDLSTEAPEQARLQFEIAEITETERGDDEGAVAAYLQVLELDPNSMPALTALERLYTKLDRSAELLRIYDRQLEIADPAMRVHLLFKAAQIWEEKLTNAGYAAACLEGVLAIEPRNVKALKALESIYRKLGDWQRLAATLELHIAASGDPAEAAALTLAMGEVWYRELNRPDQAELIFNHVLEMDPGSPQALGALGRLYERSGNWSLSLDMIRREIRVTAVPAQVIELHYRAGKIQEEMLGDLTEARTAYGRCLEIDPGYLPALKALKLIYEQAKDWDRYLDVLQQEAQVTPDGPEKTELLYEVGRFYQEQREDLPNAERYYVDALKRTPSHVPSARPLVDIYIARSDWAHAEQMLEVVTATDGDPKDLCGQYYRLGYVAEKLGRPQKALAAYRRAYELDATYLPALEGLGNLLVASQQHDEALKIYQSILIHHRDGLTDLEVVEVYFQVGEIHRAMGQGDRAQKSFEKALEIDPTHEPAHTALVAIAEEAGNFELALEHRQKLVETLEGEARYAMSLGIAKLAQERLVDPYLAIDAFVQALKIRPGEREILEPLLKLYRETKQSQRAQETLDQILVLPEVAADAATQRRLHCELAELYRDELKDDDRAAFHFNKALDADPTYAPAFAALETFLTERKAWTTLEQSYHAMIQRLPKTPETLAARLALWRTLGELYHKVLRNPEGAIVAYEVVAKANPGDPHVGEILAELYAASPGQEQKAIESNRSALKVTAEPLRVVKSLVRLHAALKEYDKAFVAAQVVLHLLEDRSSDEEQIVARLQKYAKEAPTRPLTEELWTEHLYHDLLRGPMGVILALCHRATGGALSIDHARLNINKKRDKVDVAQSMLFFANMYKSVAKTLGTENLEVFKLAGGSGMAPGNTWPVCLVIGEDLFKDRPKRELWFLIAKALAFTRPELALARMVPLEELELLFQAAVSMGVPTFELSGNPKEVEKHRRRLEKGLSENAKPELFRAAKEYARLPNPPSLRSYLEAVEITANRTGSLLSCEVDIAKRCLAQDPGAAARLPLRNKVRDLMLFSLSESHFVLRRALGLAVEVKADTRSIPRTQAQNVDPHAR